LQHQLTCAQEQIMKARKKKEATKTEALKRSSQEELTQGASESRLRRSKEEESNHKRAMKNVSKDGNIVSIVAGKAGKTNATKGKRKKSTQTRKNPDEKSNKVTNKVSTLTHGGTKQKVKPQGLRKVPEASDKHGCVHHGLLDLIALPKRYLEAYVKVDGWLYQKPCKDCVNKGGDATDRVLDLSTLLLSKGKTDVGFYCNCGPVGHKMDDDDCGWKEKWTCDMVLCVPCYEQRNNKMGCDGNKRKSSRKRLR
jgi:hypothetical protein